MSMSTISTAAADVLGSVTRMPLCSASDIAADLGRDVSGVHGALRDLQDKYLVVPENLGCLGPRVDRYHLHPGYLEFAGLTGATRHQPGNLLGSLQRLPLVETLYPGFITVDALGRVSRFEWFDGAAFDAVVECERGWVLVIYVGLLRSEGGISGLFERMGSDLESMAYGDPHPCPSLICCVVPDRWQAELVLRVARRRGLSDWVGVWCVQDDTWYGAREFHQSRGRIHQPVYRRQASFSSWENRVRQSQWSLAGNKDLSALLTRVSPRLVAVLGDEEAAKGLVERAREAIGPSRDSREAVRLLRGFAQSYRESQGTPEAAEAAAILARVAASPGSAMPGTDPLKLLLAVAEWPGIPTTMASAVLREGASGRRAQHWLLRLSDYGLLDRWRDGRVARYRLTWEGMLLLARIDGVSRRDAWDRIMMPRWDRLDGFEDHEYKVLEVVEKFIAAGCPAFAGWRDTEFLGRSGIAPDAVVLTPQGPAYLEYEQSAIHPSSISAKLDGYASGRRDNRWPVLFVCRPSAESHFHRIGRERGIDLLTATLNRVRQHGPVHNPHCWSRYGEPAVIG